MAENKKITLVDEQEQELEFTIVDYIEVDKKRYLVLLPDEDPEEGAIILRLELDDEGQEVLVEIEDDNEFNHVVSILEEEVN